MSKSISLVFEIPPDLVNRIREAEMGNCDLAVLQAIYRGIQEIRPSVAPTAPVPQATADQQILARAGGRP